MKELCADLRAEYEALDELVAGLSPRQWEAETPFLGWTVYDQIAHIAFIDGQALLATRDADAVKREIQVVSSVLGSGGSLPRTVDRMMGGHLDPGDLLERWRGTRSQLLDRLSVVDPQERFPWYGPAMGARSFATARLMETWAHGQDVYDALGRTRAGTERVRHIAHLGVATFGWSFESRGLRVPDVPVHVALTGPGEARWSWGPTKAEQVVLGSAEDFCLVVTRRRRAADTALICRGAVARAWLDIAQCFAGPPLDAPQREARP